MKITQDPIILDIVKGYKIPFNSTNSESRGRRIGETRGKRRILSYV